MKIAGMNIRKGTIQRGFVETTGYADAVGLRIPVIVAAGLHPGKTLAVVSGQHGRELNGPASAFKVISSLKPRQMRGTIIFFPAVNVLSMRQHVQDFPHEMGRSLSSGPPDDEFNLNRNWPGDLKGTLQQRITAAIWKAGVNKADAVIDLHAWSGQHIGLAWAAKRHAKLLRAFAYPWSELAISPPTRGMLEWACAKAKVPCIVCELPPQNIISAKAIRHGKRGILNVAAYMGILDEKMEFPHPRYELTRGKDIQIVAEASGLLVTTHEIGDVVEKGETILELVDLESFRARQTYRAPARMILRRCGGVWGTGLLGYHIMRVGETLAVLSEIDREWGAGESPFAH